MTDTSSIITIKREALKNNIQFIRRKIGKHIRLSSVVKSNAYGHGYKEMIPLLCDLGIDHFSVFNYYEAREVADHLTSDSDILIMGYVSDDCIEDSLSRGFELNCFSLDRIVSILEITLTTGMPAKIHLEVETGMNRSGLSYDELNAAIGILNDNPSSFKLIGFSTHLAGAESIQNHLRIQKQIKRYKQLLKHTEERGLTPEYRHIANSAAAFTYPKSRFDMVRTGIMQYGYWPGPEVFIHYIAQKSEKKDPLLRVLGWKTCVMSIKEVRTGDFIGYGLSYLAQTNMLIALIPVGYTVGYSRALSNKGRVLIRGHRCSVIGLVNMNMIIADISNIEKVNIGDEVVLIGKQHDLEIKVSAFSEISDQLNYEVLTSLSESIERKVI
ncbi:MAG: alanine racemase [Marinilabiliaceae bacterium]|jgi:alanine racemase|nr:alanine racemase [Marinilabiliaceae bacterium]